MGKWIKEAEIMGRLGTYDSDHRGVFTDEIRLGLNLSYTRLCAGQQFKKHFMPWEEGALKTMHLGAKTTQTEKDALKAAPNFDWENRNARDKIRMLK